MVSLNIKLIYKVIGLKIGHTELAYSKLKVGGK